MGEDGGRWETLYQVEKEKTSRGSKEKQKNCVYQTERGRNTFLRGRMGDRASSGEGRKLEGEARRKQKNCIY